MLDLRQFAAFGSPAYWDPLRLPFLHDFVQNGMQDVSKQEGIVINFATVEQDTPDLREGAAAVDIRAKKNRTRILQIDAQIKVGSKK